MGARRASWLFGALSLSFACSTVIDGELGTVACRAEGVFGPPACPAGQTCAGGVCASIGAPLGAPCAEGGECASGECLDPGTVGGSGPPFCSQPCCASSDCADGSGLAVCFRPDGGSGALCWPGAALERGALGTLGGGEACASDGECHSALCREGRCLDVCCSDANCGAEDPLCRVRATEASAGDAWTCGRPSTMFSMNGECDSDEDCPTGRCLPLVDDISYCARPCCGSDECGTVELKGTIRVLACEPTGGLNGHACARVVGNALGASVGSPCRADVDCRSGTCLDDFCSDACCDDASCGDPTRFACRPRASESGWALRCTRK